jgi:hypothetical protein
MKRELLAARGAFRAQRFDRKREERPHRFGVKVVFGRLSGRQPLRDELAVRSGEIERQQRGARVSLLAARGLPLVRGMAVEANAEKIAKASFAGLVRAEEVFLEGAGKEALGQVFPLFVVGTPLQAEVLVDRLPVRRDEELKGALLLCVVLRARRKNGRAPRRRESTEPPADVGFLAHRTDSSALDPAAGTVDGSGPAAVGLLATVRAPLWLECPILAPEM